MILPRLIIREVMEMGSVMAVSQTTVAVSLEWRVNVICTLNSGLGLSMLI